MFDSTMLPTEGAPHRKSKASVCRWRQSERVHPLHVVLLCACLTGAVNADAVKYTPVKWERFVKVDGQPLPVPEQWLPDEEARITHSLKLPDAVPKPVPFDFNKAWWQSWLPGKGAVNVQYFNHLCSTEAGEWIFRKVEKVEGLYFARPQGKPSDDFLRDPYGPEAPWIQRHFQLIGGSARDDGMMFVSPPAANYRFVEQPRRTVTWQKNIASPYIRLFGLIREREYYPKEHPSKSYKEIAPMQMAEIARPTSVYGYTWRGIRRERDREHGIAGGELVIYDLDNKEVLGLRRTFQITENNPRGPGDALWLLSPSCSKTPSEVRFNEIGEFASRVLKTIEPSSFGRKQ